MPTPHKEGMENTKQDILNPFAFVHIALSVMAPFPIEPKHSLGVLSFCSIQGCSCQLILIGMEDVKPSLCFYLSAIQAATSFSSLKVFFPSAAAVFFPFSK